MSEEDELVPGVYRLVFDVEKYCASVGITSFYPRIIVEFTAAAGESKYHIPLLLSPFGYTTYRGT